jgi:hypothetical protein
LGLLFLMVWLFLIVASFAVLKLLFGVYPAMSGFRGVFLGVIRVLVGVVMGLGWLVLWRRLARAYFLWAVSKRGVHLK